MTYADAAAHLARVVGRVIDELEAQGAELPADLAKWRSLSSERFTAYHTPAHDSVERYRQDLEDAYGEWADDAAAQLAAEKDSVKREALLAVLLALLLARLTNIANTELPNAIALGLNGTPGSPEAYQEVAKVLAENAQYLDSTLIPAIQAEMQSAINDPAIIAAIEANNPALAEEALKAHAASLNARVAQYAGSWWRLLNYGIGQQAANLGMRIRWTRDQHAQHCPTCLQYGEKEYDSFAAMMLATGGIGPADGTECGPNCRCLLELVGSPIGKTTQVSPKYKIAGWPA